MAELSLSVGSRTLNLILLAVFGLLVTDAAINPLGMRDLAFLRRDRIQLEAMRSRLVAENADLNDTIGRLRGDDTYLRRLIHRELGYVNSDELIYRFPHPSEGLDNDTGPISPETSR
jgi:cell division protein FtsB